MMRKLSLFLLCCSISIFLMGFLSGFLPEINLQITINPQHNLVAEAQQTNKAHCVVLYNYEVDKIGDEINKLYAKGYRLKGFSTVSTPLNYAVPATDVLRSYAAICRE